MMNKPPVLIDNFIRQGAEAEKQMKILKKMLCSDLIKKGFNVTMVQDSIIISKDKDNDNGHGQIK